MTPALLRILALAAGVHAELLPDGRILAEGVVLTIDEALSLWAEE